MDRLGELADGSVHCVVTSPPYWGLRDYGTARWEGGDPKCDHKVGRFTSPASDKQKSNAGSGERQAAETCPRCGARRIDQQIGLERTPGEYVRKMVAVFREVRRVLRDDGTLWLNLGDSYATQGGTGAQGQTGQRADRTFTAEGSSDKGVPPGLKAKDLCMMPARVAMALQADGWWLRACLPWVKRNPMPESTRDRPTSALEYVFLMTKASRYFFDMEAVRAAPSGITGGLVFGGRNKGTVRRADGARIVGREFAPEDRERYMSNGRAFRNTDLYYQSIAPPHGMIFCDDELVGLDVNPQAYSEAHFATFPEKLVEPLILAGTSEKGCCPECGAPWVRVV
ncbi:MAG TPA: DNA methyltransferase, partial [Phycisphaerae bacterium]|nr:DNA methyltransferase [Phycisphaerae bacterium]